MIAWMWAGGALASAPVDEVLGDLEVGLGLRSTEIEGLAPELERFVQGGGRLGHARNLVAVGVGRDCRGDCLITLARGLADGLVVGLDDGRAADVAIAALDGLTGDARRPVSGAALSIALSIDLRRAVACAPR